MGPTRRRKRKSSSGPRSSRTSSGLRVGCLRPAALGSRLASSQRELSSSVSSPFPLQDRRRPPRRMGERPSCLECATTTTRLQWNHKRLACRLLATRPKPRTSMGSKTPECVNLFNQLLWPSRTRVKPKARRSELDQLGFVRWLHFSSSISN